MERAGPEPPCWSTSPALLLPSTLAAIETPCLSGLMLFVESLAFFCWWWQGGHELVTGPQQRRPHHNRVLTSTALPTDPLCERLDPLGAACWCVGDKGYENSEPEPPCCIAVRPLLPATVARSDGGPSGGGTCGGCALAGSAMGGGARGGAGPRGGDKGWSKEERVE